MSEIFREVDEALTYDRLHALWKGHRIKVLATLLVALASLASWQAWQYRQQQQRTRAAETFYELLRKDAQKGDQVTVAELSPQEQQSLRGGYRMLWLFSRAKIFAQQAEWQQAQQALQQIADDGSLPQLYRRYAQLQQASLDIEQGKLAAAEKRLATLTSKKNDDIPALQGLALYLQASLLATQGNKKDAHDLLTRARSLDNLAPALQRQLQEAEHTLEATDTP